MNKFEWKKAFLRVKNRVRERTRSRGDKNRKNMSRGIKNRHIPSSTYQQDFYNTSGIITDNVYEINSENEYDNHSKT